MRPWVPCEQKKGAPPFLRAMDAAEERLRALAPAGCVFHVADKVPGNADSAQASVNAIGLAALREGKRVVRLKVGDPFLYGRGGEECEFYRAHGFEARVAALVLGVK